MILVSLLAAPSFAQTVSAAESHGGELTRWVPSVALEVGIAGHTGRGDLRGTELTGPRVFIDPDDPAAEFGDLGTAVVDPFSGREEVLAALVGSTFEIMTPQLLDVPTHPRLFLDLNVSVPLGLEVNLAVDGDPGPLSISPDKSPVFVVGEASIIGRGSLVSVQPQGPQIHAGLGMALTFDFGPQRIRLKPSIVYTRIRQDIHAVTNRVVRLSDRNGAPEDIDLFNSPDDFRFILLRANQNEIYHGIGPALELEFETGNRIGPLAATLFMKVHGARLFGDLETEFTESNPDFPGEQVSYRFRQERWTYRGSVGIRFRFVPRSGR